MLKSLEKLRKGCWLPAGKDTCNPDYFDTKNIAEEIQAEVDKCYLPRPLFEDGEPAQFGDQFEHSGGIDAFLFFEDGTREVWSRGERFVLQSGERLSRPPEPDTQEKIDEDYQNETNSLIVDSGRGCMTRERAFKYVERFDELMARQRKLDGVES